MNERIKELIEKAGFHMRPHIDGIHDGIDWSSSSYGYDTCLEKFANLIIEEHIKLLRREWYDRNSEEYPEDISPRDIGVKVGQKNQIVVLIEKIKQYWNI